jgi:type IV pilus assembly protein PilP
MPVTRAVLITTLLVGLSAGAARSQTAPAATQQAAAAPAAPAVPATPAAAPQPKGDAVEPQGFTYDPDGRRDPFVSLLRRGADSGLKATRTSGLAGLGTAEVSLRGTMLSQGRYVGILQGVDSKTYIVRAGDKLSDGTIRAISADSMTILQQVNDPLSLAKEREVRKLIRQTEEGK